MNDCMTNYPHLALPSYKEVLLRQHGRRPQHFKTELGAIWMKVGKVT